MSAGERSGYYGCVQAFRVGIVADRPYRGKYSLCGLYFVLEQTENSIVISTAYLFLTRIYQTIR